VIDRRGSRHAQKRTTRVQRTQRTQINARSRPSQSAGASKPRAGARPQVASRTHMTPTAPRASRDASHSARSRPKGGDRKSPAVKRSSGARVPATTQKAPATATRMERRRAVRRRRAVLTWVVCGGLCLLVLATSFPAQALIRQHDAIKSATSELQRLTAGNNSLRRQADELSDPENIAALARSDYGMVSSGEKAYSVLPLAGSAVPTSVSSGHSVLDQGPVAPGSDESQALLGDAPSGSGASSSSGTGSSGSKTAGANHTPGLWNRVLDTLEFWR
jgi:cell division protein FtsB